MPLPAPFTWPPPPKNPRPATYDEVSIETTPGSTLARMPCTSCGLTTLLVLLANTAAGTPVPPLLAAAVTPAPTAAPTGAATPATDTHRGPPLPASQAGAGAGG